MLDDRSYMRSNPHRSPWNVTIILMIVIVVCFALQQICLVYVSRTFVEDYLALSTAGLKRGFLWQFFTFQFLHGGLGHLFGNLIGLYFFGRPVEARLGAKTFLKVYFLSGLGGGVLQSTVQWWLPDYYGTSVIGASAGVLGIIAAFAMMEPEAPVFFSFILPLRAKHLLWIELAIGLFFTLVPAPSGAANAAHLGGILVAMAYMRWDAQRVTINWNPLEARRRKRQLVQTAAQVAKWRPRREATRAGDLPPDEFISKEVDPILDKISAHGIHSLTEREREILEAARAKMSKR